MENSSYNPDVLNCIANLSNDEVFTPPELANNVLDLLPQELFRSPQTTFLDPFTKSGVFLREIVKRLDRGLESVIPDRQERIDHILHNQVFGIACTELTSLLSRRSVYCSKSPDGKYSVSRFKTPSGNILYSNINHTWEGGKCKYCGASQAVYDRGSQSEQYAYMFIHTDNPGKFFNNMKFDVIIGNPPYQLSDGGGMQTESSSGSAIPLYHKFVEQAKKLKPRYLSMIIPARWYSGGRGLDDFREEMLNDTHLKILVDFFNSEECFPGIDLSGGVCYFLWDYSYSGDCSVVSKRKGQTNIMNRPLLEKGMDSFIRFNEAISIYRKVKSTKCESFDSIVSSSKPFGMRSNFSNFFLNRNTNHSIRLYRFGNDGFVSQSEVLQNQYVVRKYKVYVAKAYGERGEFPYNVIGKPFIGEPNSCCTETYLFCGPFNSLEESQNVISYMNSKFFRFLVLQKKNTQNASKTIYSIVPLQDFSHPWTDEMLYKKYGLTEDEIAFIESMIRPME